MEHTKEEELYQNAKSITNRWERRQSQIAKLGFIGENGKLVRFEGNLNSRENRSEWNKQKFYLHKIPEFIEYNNGLTWEGYKLHKDVAYHIWEKYGKSVNNSRAGKKQEGSYNNAEPERKTVTSKQFVRDRKVVNHIRGIYESCVMPGCEYRDVDVAHIHALKHGAKDVPENCIPLCPNHHRDLDKGRIHLQYLGNKCLSVRTYDGKYLGTINARHTLDESSIEKAMESLAPYMRAL